MKLRLQDDALRLRLTVGEVARIGAGHRVVARTRFPGGAALTYALEATAEGTVSATLSDATVTVRIPRQLAQAWAHDPEWISLSPGDDLRGCSSPRILVEKDFACLTPRAEDDADDLFVNPRAADARAGSR